MKSAGARGPLASLLKRKGQHMLGRLAVEIAGLARVAPPSLVISYLGAMVAEAPAILSSRTLAAADRRISGEVPFRIWGGVARLDCEALDRDLLFDPSSAFGLVRELFGRNVYLRAFKPFSAHGDLAIDLGGNRGIATVLMATAFAPATIIYVEPDSRYLQTMRTLMSAYPETRVEAHKGFAGAAPGGTEEPLDLDAIIPEGPIAFLKMDIEGAEEPLLTGSAKWIDRVQRIAMESHPAMCDVAEVVRALEKRGFLVLPTDAVGRRCSPADAGFVYASRSAEHFA